jgi:hypothetical protein
MTNTSLETQRQTGLDLFQREKFAEAQEIWLGITKSSQDPNDWFNLATSATMSKEIKAGKAAFDKALELADMGKGEFNVSRPTIFYYYMKTLIEAKEFERAFGILQNLLTSHYLGTGNTDDTHLFLSNGGVLMPSFESVISDSEPIFQNIEKIKACNFLSDLKTKVNKEGKEVIEQVEKRLG